MSQISKVAKEKKRIFLYKKYLTRRMQLKKIISSQNKNISLIIKMRAMFSLSILPRDSSRVRRNRRCLITGTSRSVSKTFGINRIVFRKYANLGLLPGVRKSSW